MASIDFILNLAGLLLWLSWRSMSPSLAPRPAVPTLLSTLKRTEPAPRGRWLFPAAVAALLSLRAVFYWNIGAKLKWIPRLDFGAVSVPFNSDRLPHMLVFSGLSFLVVLGVFYLWLLLLSMVHRRLPDNDPHHHVVRVCLGRLDDLAMPFKLILPVVLSGFAWFVVCHLLGRMGIIPTPTSTVRVWKESALIGVGSLLAWKYLIVGILVIHLVHSYVYLGTFTWWNYASHTAQRFLLPLAWAPLQLGRIDFAPVVTIALVFLTTRLGDQWLGWVYQHLGP